MQPTALKSRKSKCAGWWYPAAKASHGFKDNPVASAIISPHAGFEFSGMVSLEAVSYVKKNRVWILGTSHYERIKNGISIFHGEYNSSIGKTAFPQEAETDLPDKYFTNEGHSTEEHSIENVLYSLNHFSPEVQAFCVLVQVSDKSRFEKIADDIASAWKPGDSIIVSTDWNHFVPVNKIDRLMKDAAKHLISGDIEGLYKECMQGNLEACGIDALFLASRILEMTGESVKFKVLVSKDSSSVTGPTARAGRKHGEKCVGYIAAANNIA